jgi:hypothetical protein
MVASGLKPLFEEEAQQREDERKRDRGQGAEFCPLDNHEEKGKSADKAAGLMKVSRLSVQAADRVRKQGVESLVAAVAAGTIAVSSAARIAALPPEVQQAAVARLESARARRASGRAGQASRAGAARVDDDGRHLPKSLMPAFRLRPKLEQLCQRLDRAIRDLERLKNNPGAVYLDVEEVSGSLTGARQKVAAARPSRLCPHPAEAAACCDTCRGHGWIPAGKT